MFGIDIFDASLTPALLVAIVAGVISFLSPCVLPIVPPYLAYMGGISMSEMTDGKTGNGRVITAAIMFALGLSTVFLFLGFAASAFGQIFLQYQQPFSVIAGAVIFLFGLHFMGVISIPFLYREARLDVGDKGGSAFGAYILGLAFAFGWTPCIGPILGAILSLAAAEGSSSRGVILMAGYALGLGMPFILAAVFIKHAVTVMNKFKKHMVWIERAMGLLLMAVGVLLMTGAFSALSFWLLETFPFLALVG